MALTAPAPYDLTEYNRVLFDHCGSNPRIIDSPRGPNRGVLYTVLLSRSNFVNQMLDVNELLARLGFDELILSGANQKVSMSKVDITNHGSGLRCVLPILAALTSDHVDVILIDEPEISLEARAQKILKQILLEAVDKGKTIIAATQSHLFLHPSKPEKNYKIEKDNGALDLTPLKTEDDILDLTYSLLGNSLEDLHFPANFLIVEGSSDETICKGVADLLDVPTNKVKIIAARGLDNISNSLTAIENTLIPLKIDYSPYSNKVVAILDKPLTESSQIRVDSIKRALAGRCTILPNATLEDYLPDALYTKAGRDKSADLNALENIKKETNISKQARYVKQNELKNNIATSIADSIQVEDLLLIPELVNSLKLAAQLADFNNHSEIQHV